MVLTAIFQRLSEQGDHAASTFIHRAAHIFRQVAHFCRQLDGQAATDNSLLAELIQRVLIISQQAVTIVAVAMIEVARARRCRYPV